MTQTEFFSLRLLSLKYSDDSNWIIPLLCHSRDTSVWGCCHWSILMTSNWVIRVWIVSNHLEYQSQWRIFKTPLYPRVFWLWLECLHSRNRWGGTQIQTYWEEETFTSWRLAGTLSLGSSLYSAGSWHQGHFKAELCVCVRAEPLRHSSESIPHCLQNHKCLGVCGA